MLRKPIACCRAVCMNNHSFVAPGMPPSCEGKPDCCNLKRIDVERLPQRWWNDFGREGVAFCKCLCKFGGAGRPSIRRSFKVETPHSQDRCVCIEVYRFSTGCIEEMFPVVVLDEGVPPLDVIPYGWGKPSSHLTMVSIRKACDKRPDIPHIYPAESDD